jgi:hypothetical protein
MEAGDLVFVREKGIIPSIIRFFDKGKFNHVAVAYSDTEIIEAQYNTLVRVIPLTYTDYEVVPLKLGDNSNIEVFAQHFIGTKYDFSEILNIWLRLLFGISFFSKFNTPKEVICSELAGYYLEERGVFERGVELLAPNELYKAVKNKGY